MQVGRRAVIPAAMLPLLAVACSGAGETGETDPSPPPPPATTDPPRPDDGTLRIGVMAPRLGDGATISESLIAAVRQTVDEVNAAGGVGGGDVELVVEDEGVTPTSAGEAIEALGDQDVDAVVGPTSSVLALSTLGDLLAGGMMACSPTATALALDDYPGSERFFRTAPSDTLQAEAIAELAEQTGARTAAVAYLDDSYGRPLGQATVAALAARELTVDAQVPYPAGEEDLVDRATELVEPQAGVLVIIGDADEGTRLLAAVGEVVSPLDDADLPAIILNDALRRPSAPALVQELPPALREQVRGVSPVAAEEPNGLFGTNAVDCVNLIALAAVQAQSDNPTRIAGEMVEASAGGVGCADFAACAELLADNRNIDYEGPSGDVEIGGDGDPQQARFEVFTFDEAGVDQPLRTFWI